MKILRNNHVNVMLSELETWDPGLMLFDTHLKKIIRSLTISGRLF